MTAAHDSLERLVKAVHTMWDGRYDVDADGLEVPREHEAKYGCPVAVDLGQLAVAHSEAETVMAAYGRPLILLVHAKGKDAIKEAVDRLNELYESDESKKMLVVPEDMDVRVVPILQEQHAVSAVEILRKLVNATGSPVPDHLDGFTPEEVDLLRVLAENNL